MGFCFSKLLNREPLPDPPVSQDQTDNSTSNPQPEHKPASPPPSSSSGSQLSPILDRPLVDLSSLYDLGKKLGSGNFATVYRCTDKSNGREYACKSISKSKLINPKQIEDVRREVMIFEHLTGQPNIVEFRGAYEDKDDVHLIMELCSGGELFDRITKKGSFSEKEAANIFRQIISVVNVCHFMGVVHRDLKPENFLLVSNEEDSPIKATDFGLSLFIEEGKVQKS